MSGGTSDLAAIAAALTASERAALLALDGAAWSKAPGLEETTTLLFCHGIPLIAVVGDWAKRTRAGDQVCRELQRLAEQAS